MLIELVYINIEEYFSNDSTFVTIFFNLKG